MSSTNIQIAIKVRPLIEREKREKMEPVWLVKENNIVQLDSIQNFIGEPYSFDHIFDYTKSNRDVYDAVVKPLVMSCLEGINCTIFAYGQTSSGKTHTMLGDKNIPGIISFTVEDIFGHISESAKKNFLLRCSYLEIYNERINDLLDTNATDIKIREDYNQGVYVVVKEEVIRESGELFNLMKKGMKTRKMGCTDMNERSSRSHTIFKLIIQSQNKDSEGSYTESTLSLVDLAGSERVGQMNMAGVRQVEGVSINKSLTTLGLVIRKLSENEPFINYRDSKLTRLLQHSLGGNSSTLIIATITVATSEETKSTLEFAQRAKYVKNRPIKNEKVTDKDQLKQYEHLCEGLKEQIEKLRLEKTERDKTIDALEDKICNIKLFTAGSMEPAVESIRRPNRRHTLANYNPHKKILAVMDTGGLKENSDTLLVSPVISNVEDKENSLLDDSVFNSPCKLIVPKTPKSPETPKATLRLEKQLLEESYLELKSFTNLERQLQGNSDELEELRELTERLRDENLELREENIKRGDSCIKYKETYRNVYENLVVLRTILEVTPQVRMKSLHTIMEEDIELSNCNFDSSICDDEADNTIQLLKEQLNEKERIIADLQRDIEADKLQKELEQRELKSEISTKNATIDKLKATIIQDKDVKEAELKIFTDTIKKLNDYKEEMHQKLSELQMAQESQSEEDFNALKAQNLKLKEELNDLGKNHENVKQLAEFDKMVIVELKKEIDTLKNANETLVSRTNEAMNELSLQLESRQRELNEQTVCYNNFVIKYDSKLADCEHLTRENKELVMKQKAQEKEVGELKKLKEDLIMQKNGLMSEVSGLKEDNEKLKSELQVVLVNLQNLGQQIDEKAELRDELTSKIMELDEKTKAYNIILSNYNAMKAENEKRLEEIKNLTEEHKNSITSLEKTYTKDIQTLQATSEEQARAIHQLKNELQLKILELGEKTDSYSHILSNYDAIKAKNEQLLEEIKNLEKGKTELMQQLDCNASLEHTVHSYLNDIKTLQVTTEAQKAKIAELESQLDSMLSKLNEKTESYNNVLSNYNDKLREVQNLDKEKKELEQTVHSHLNDIKTLQDTSDAQKTKIAELEMRLDSRLSKLNEKAESYNDVLSNYNGKLKEVENLNKEKKELEQTVHSHLNDIKTLQDTSDAQKTKIAELESRLNSRSSKLNEKNESYNDVLLNYNSKSLECAQQLKEIQNINNAKKELEQTVHSYLNDIQTRQVTTGVQKAKIAELESQLDSMLSKLNEKTESYNDVLSNYNGKLKEVENLDKEKKELEQTVHSYLNDIQTLQVTTEAQKAKIAELESQLDSMLSKLNEKTEAYNDVLLNYNGKLKEVDKDKKEWEKTVYSYLNDIKVLQVTSDAQKTKISELESQLDLRLLKLNEKNECYNDVLSNYNSKSLECAQQLKEIQNLNKAKEELEQTVRSYLKDLKALQGTADAQKAEIAELESQLDTSLSKLNEKTESYNDILSNYNGKLLECKQQLKEIQNLNKDKKELEQTVHSYRKEINTLQVTSDAQKIEITQLTIELRSKLSELNKNERLLNENAVLKEQVNNVSHNSLNTLTEESSNSDELKPQMQEILNLKEDIRNKSEQIERLSKDKHYLNVKVQELESSLLNTKRQLKERCEDYSHIKGKLNTLEMQLLNCKKELTNKKQELEKEKGNSVQGEQALNLNNHLIDQAEHLNNQLKDLKNSYSILESQFNVEKSKVDSLTSQLQNSQCEIQSLLARESDLVLCEKRIQSDRNPVTRISDEGRPLSPNELRKIRRQSIHDQRRGLTVHSANLLDEEDLGCSECVNLRATLSSVEAENKKFIAEIEELKKENKFFDKENEDMLQIIKELEKRQSELYEQLDKCKSSTDVSSSDAELNKLRSKLINIIAENTELQNELKHNKKVIKKSKEKIAELERKHAQAAQEKAQTDDKGTQATCDLHQKYLDLKKIALLRRKEGNFLRSKLSLQPDCPVLPEDVQREQRSDSSKVHVP